MVELVEEWINRVNGRSDLLPRWKKRTILLTVQANSYDIKIFISQDGMRLTREKGVTDALQISSTYKVFHQLLGGNLKLTSLPKSIVKIDGDYRDVLLVESLLMLSH
ncbi:hypothetical protein [Halobacillus naozhouensis]|uniref:SCP-2 sterol transfer family protein n=1 Tax=Halobacillus naozhouensis TaxID=554880 RepID=A0ABY8IWE6_9BACI|nr:hypothetical protein [Halobacillus naozhouensis]WFT73654.1 hypothetical protein P9989_14915 [Halobacillus naozhouensis]